VPLKPIYGKTPLTEMKALPLYPGQITVKEDCLKPMETLLKGAAEADMALWESALRLSFASRDVTGQTKLAALIRDTLKDQKDNGEMPLPLNKALQVMNAAWALYEVKPDKQLLESMMRWCASLAADWSKVEDCTAIRTGAGDLMKLLCNLYRVTGRKGLTTLCEKLRQLSIDWSGALHTFSVQRPMKKMIDCKTLDEGMAAENGNGAGFYTRQYLLCHGETLADGARACLESSVYSGNGPESRAAKDGWEKISRWHGAVCGGVTSDETLAGLSANSAVDAASLGAWAETFAKQLEVDADSAWAASELEKLMKNGMPAAVQSGKLVCFQRGNGLEEDCGTKDCYRVQHTSVQKPRALARLARGWAAAVEHAVMVIPAGAQVNLYLNGEYSLKMNGQAVKLIVSGQDGEYTIEVEVKEDVKASVALMVPAWTDDACIRVNDEGADEGHAGTYLTLERTWKNGDCIHVSFAQCLKVKEGYHQSAVISYGAKTMAYVPQNGLWAVALCDEPEVKDGKVVVKLAHVPGWKAVGAVPNDLPVRPETDGDVFEAELKPYAETSVRMTMLPRSSKA
jgi:hypothetical protein